MNIIVGLGNPGRKYEATRHNVGFAAVDYFADRHQIQINKIKHKALIGEGFVSGKKILLVKPQTYMNLSGGCVREIVEYYKADLKDLIVVYDDIDIEPGRIRIRAKGSAGTHNGMRSIIYDLKSDNFPRIRIGIGKNGQMDLADYVLSGFLKEEKKLVENAVANAAEAIETMLHKGIEAAMNEYNKAGDAES